MEQSETCYQIPFANFCIAKKVTRREFAFTMAFFLNEMNRLYSKGYDTGLFLVNKTYILARTADEDEKFWYRMFFKRQLIPYYDIPEYQEWLHNYNNYKLICKRSELRGNRSDYKSMPHYGSK